MAQLPFWNAILLYVKRPNLINRRVIGGQVLAIWTATGTVPMFDCLASLTWPVTSISELCKQLNLCEVHSSEITTEDLHCCSTFIVIHRKLFRKQSLKALQKQQQEKQMIDSGPKLMMMESGENIEHDILMLCPKDNLFASIAIKLEPNSGHIGIQRENSVCYCLSLSKGSSAAADTASPVIEVSYLFDFPSNYWVEKVLVAKMEQWMNSSDQQQSGVLQGSLRAISVENYCANYNRLKSKYSLPLLDIWSKVEKTDPIKFIFEDIAIAAYLLTLWAEEREKDSTIKMQTFADIGCGNGLLVYILAGEGHDGYGIDIRARNIWSHYPSFVKLIEKQIDVFAEDTRGQLASEVDWLIGNHSDELTPWIIYMAGNLSPRARAFLLPCCCFDFDGLKFQRTTEPNKSQYQCYIDYLHTLCTDFGFRCFRDKLRIPSTKRICLVCHGRSYSPDLTGQLGGGQIESKQSVESGWQHKRRSIVEQRLSLRPASSLRLRAKEEPVRNCTRIDQAVKQRIIERLATKLIDFHGQGITFNEAIQLLDYEMRTQLKKQCGGLQTFIRNHKHIFAFRESRIVFQSGTELRAKHPERVKSRPCWFHHHHPDGCPLTESDCAYQH